MEKINIIEGLLYIAGDLGLSEEALIMHVPITKLQLENEINTYKKEQFVIEKHGDMYFLKTSPDMEKYISRVLNDRPQKKLSQASLEVLAIIAYNQPISRNGIESVRGIVSDGPISTLINKGLVKKKTIQDERASHFETTQQFLEVFGLKSLSDLPTDDMISEQEEIDLFFNSLKEQNT